MCLRALLHSAASGDINDFIPTLQIAQTCRPHCIPAQFISILTSAGLDGIEHLAKVSWPGPRGYCGRLITEDVKNARLRLERGKKKYGGFIPD